MAASSSKLDAAEGGTPDFPAAVNAALNAEQAGGAISGHEDAPLESLFEVLKVLAAARADGCLLYPSEMSSYKAAHREDRRVADFEHVLQILMRKMSRVLCQDGKVG